MSSIASHYRNAVQVCPRPKIDKKDYEIVPDTCSSCVFMHPTINGYGCFQRNPKQSGRRIMHPSKEGCENYKNNR